MLCYKLLQNEAKTWKGCVIFTIIVFVAFSIGLTTGYIVIKFYTIFDGNESPNNVMEAMRTSCSATSVETDTGKVYLERFLERQDKMFSCIHSSEECWNYGLPRTYLVNHLNDKKIEIDGKLDDEAWNEVPWSEPFADIRSTIYGKPIYDTKFKMRWDNDNLYIGVYLQENNLWATNDVHDSAIYSENSLEILLGIDGFSFNYKQIDINVLGTILDLLMFKSPYETGFESASNLSWNSTSNYSVHFEGTLNTPGDIDKLWSVEMALPFQRLSEGSHRVHDSPIEDEVWPTMLGRSQPNITVINGKYEKGPSFYWKWWSWQPCDAFNMHLQHRWGLIQFKHNIHDNEFKFPQWHIYKALFEMHDALEKYKAVSEFYTYTIEALDVPPYLLSRACVDIPDISIRGSDFNITVNSMLISGMSANIRSDRYVTFH